jgi:hypothetical protein
LLVLLVSFSPSTASAGLINSALDPALAGSTLFDFDDQTIGDFVTLTLDSVTFTAFEAPITPHVDYLRIGDASEGGSYGGTGHELSTVGSNLGFNISFGTAVSAFAMNWGGANENWTVRLFDSANTLIETLTFLGGDPGKGATYIEFYGAKADSIKSVELRADSADWVKIDDFQFVPQAPTSVPEPATLPFVLGALTGLGGLRWWRGRAG